uniref:Uncharacterized protein n=1 Tax=Avena sativa TaxID=4498 RepID=A0ACD5XDD4_AVESA
MVSPDVVRNIVGILGNIISLGLFLTPVPTFWTIIEKKDAGEFSPDPYLATLVNCILWVFYGLPFVHPNSMLVLTINGTGLVIESIYIAIFFSLASSKKRTRILLVLGAVAVFMVGLVLVVLLGADTYEERSLIVGTICVIAGTAMYAAPLTVIQKVIRTKSVEFMPISLSLVGLLNGTCWTTYALIKFDLYITIPNGLGVMFSIAQVILYLCYYNATPNKDANVEMSPIQTTP